MTIRTVGICLILVAGALANSGVSVSPQTSITSVEEGYHSSLGVVNGARHCGGKSKFIQLRYETCNGTGICQVPGDNKSRRAELEFIPDKSASHLGFRFLMISEGEVIRVFDKSIENSKVEAGKNYMLTASGGPAPELKGKQITLQYVLYHVGDEEVTLCVEADYNIV